MEEMKSAAVVVIAALAVACGPVRDVVTEESAARHREKQMANARAGMYGPDGVEKVAQGLTCVEFGPGGSCQVWCPTPPSPWFLCYNDPNPLPNELVLYDSPNYQGCCAGSSNQIFQINLQEWNDRPRSAKSRRSKRVTLWSEAEWWGIPRHVEPGADIPELLTSDPQYGISSSWEE
jgi:hypothetical protein